MKQRPDSARLFRLFSCALAPIAALSLAAGCGTSAQKGDGNGGGGGGGGGISPDGGMSDPNDPPDLPPPMAGEAMYAHSAYDLYRIDPDSLEVELVGEFDWPDSDERSFDTMGDIAIDKDGNMFGVSVKKSRVYAVNATNAEVTLLAPFEVHAVYNALSFVPSQDGDGEDLIGADREGNVFKIDPFTGAATQVGSYGEGIGSAGDLVYVEGFGIVATVFRKKDGTTGDSFLAAIDPATYEASLIGDTGEEDIWGLAFWKGELYGFTSNGSNIETDDGDFLTLDVDDGSSSSLGKTPAPLWGGAVTTAAPTVD